MGLDWTCGCGATVQKAAIVTYLEALYQHASPHHILCSQGSIHLLQQLTLGRLQQQQHTDSPPTHHTSPMQSQDRTDRRTAQVHKPINNKL